MSLQQVLNNPVALVALIWALGCAFGAVRIAWRS
jgi:hypothetical protein